MPCLRKSYFFTFIAPSGLPPYDLHICCTPWSVFQDGSFTSILSATFTPQGAPREPSKCPVLASQAQHKWSTNGTQHKEARQSSVLPSAALLGCKSHRGEVPSQALFRRAKLLLTRASQVNSAGATIDSSVSLSAISRTIELSLQSSFHLSLTVLFRYRSLANI